MKQPIPFVTPPPRRVNRYRPGHFRRKIMNHPVVKYLRLSIAIISSLIVSYLIYLNS